MKKIAITLLILFGLGMVASSCVRSSKTCRQNQKKVKSLRKSGALKM